MDTVTATVTIVSIVTTQTCGLLALWLRLHYGVRLEQVQGPQGGGTDAQRGREELPAQHAQDVLLRLPVAGFTAGGAK